MYKSREKGFVQIFLFLLLLAGLGLGLWLVQTKTGFFSKAAPVVPTTPETSFELEAQAATEAPFADAAALKSVSVGQKFRVDIWARSDIDAANLFVVNLKFDQDKLKVVGVNPRGANSFVNQWIDMDFSNNSGNVKMVGGVNCAFAGWAIDGDSQETPLQVDFWLEKNKPANVDLPENIYLGWIRADQNRADLPFVNKSHGFNFSASDILASWVSPNGTTYNPKEQLFTGQQRTVTAFGINIDSEGNRKDKNDPGGPLLHTGLANGPKTVNCAALAVTPTPGSLSPTSAPTPTTAPVNSPVPTQSPTLMVARLLGSVIFEAKTSGSANIRFADNSQILRLSDQADILPWNNSDHSYRRGLTLQISQSPTAALNITSGSQDAKVGDTITFRAYLSNASSGQIWITKGDGAVSFPCPDGSIRHISNQKYWCLLKEDNGTSLEGSYTVSEVGSYTATVNAFVHDNRSGSGPGDQCTGTPSFIGYDTNTWSSCGDTSSQTKTVSGGTSFPTPAPTALWCIDVTADAPLGKDASGKNLYIANSDSEGWQAIKFMVHVSPENAEYTVGNWSALPPAGLPPSDVIANFQGGSGNFGFSSKTSGIYTIKASISTPLRFFLMNDCPEKRISVNSITQQATTSTQSVKLSDVEVQNLRHDGDVNSDSKFDLADMSALLAQFNQSGQSEADLTSDGVVNSSDVIKLKSILTQKGVLGGGQ
ncbi:MAG: hypothetical protein UV41_C0022G0002 [Candidatus Daviesbacteria bacterium GW2011_GWA2_42_7]|uniref:Dockerin domain-containing protein n=1 Tax=Candidatus Daviesbacteria bacterium GW2011_GWA2_42_7 TaxID=1618425 RepID=A0A0G1DI16_9BACT|nr:MAG: hypothetical protein UV41_C0022G0002 [Candidatus Daviesbacteria bacterium GW2011_GWA2_42_7]